MSTPKAHDALWDALSAIVEDGVLCSGSLDTADLHRDAVKALELAATERAQRERPTGHPNKDGHQVQVQAHGSRMVAIVTVAYDEGDEPAYAIELQDAFGSPQGCITTSYPGRAGWERAQDQAAACMELLTVLDELEG